MRATCSSRARRAAQGQRPLHERARLVHPTQAEQDLREVVADAGLGPFVAQLDGGGQRMTVRLLSRCGGAEVEGLYVRDLRLGPELHPAVTQCHPRRQRRTPALERNTRLLLGLHGFGGRAYGFDAKQVGGRRRSQRFHADLVPSPRGNDDVARLQGQLVDAVRSGHERDRLGPDGATGAVRRQHHGAAGRGERGGHVHAALLDEHLKVLAGVKLDLVAVRLARGHLALDDRARGQEGDGRRLLGGLSGKRRAGNQRRRHPGGGEYGAKWVPHRPDPEKTGFSHARVDPILPRVAASRSPACRIAAGRPVAPPPRCGSPSSDSAPRLSGP